MTGFDITTSLTARIERLYEKKVSEMKAIQDDEHTQDCVKKQLTDTKIAEMWGIAQAMQLIREYERVYYKELKEGFK